MQLAFISDIHEDHRRLVRTLKKISTFGYDKLVCLGDIGGFSYPHYRYKNTRDAHACLSVLRDYSTIIIPGNHDLQAIRKLPAHSDIFEFPENWYSLDRQSKKSISSGKIWIHDENDLIPNYTSEDIDFLKTLPEYTILNSSHENILVSHYIFPNLSGFQKGFYVRISEFSKHFALMTELECQLSFTGHSHIRGGYLVDKSSFKEYSYRRVRLKELPVCIGIPPVTRRKNRTGFCIFKIDSHVLKFVKS